MMSKWINKILLSKQNQEEHAALEQWRGDLQTNLDAMKEQLAISKIQEEMKDYEEVDKNKAWANISAQIEIKQDTPVRHIAPLYKYAAVVVLLLASILVFKSFAPSASTPLLHQYAQKTSVSLRDKSIVSLSANSSLIENDARSTTLSGHAYFDITPDKDHPFKVKLHHGEIVVLGTEFDIITKSDYTQIYVTEGKVKYSFGGQERVLVVGDLVTVDTDGKITFTKANIQTKSWQNNKVKFTNESMVNVLYSIAAMHHMQLVFDLREGAQKDLCKINTAFTTETLNQILTELSTITELKYELKGDKLIVKSFKC
jgi:transmembrane sensor